jgi:hypothetical protein
MSELGKCRVCGADRPEGEKCPACGAITVSGAQSGKKTAKVGCAIVFVLAVVLITVLCAVAVTDDNSPSRSATPTTAPRYTSTRPAPTREYITYRADGTAGNKVVVCYASGDGSMSQRDVVLPWTSERIAVSPGDFLYISVQNHESYGSVVAKIVCDGVVVRESSSSGAYVIASVSGSW